MAEVRSTTTVCISARQIREDGIVDEKAPQTHGWVYRLEGWWKNNQEAIDQAIAFARACYGTTHENFKFDRSGDNYVEVADASAPRGYRIDKLYDYERGHVP